MIRNPKIMTAIAAMVSATAQPGHSDIDAVHLYNWSHYLDPAVIRSFEAENAVPIVQDTYGDSDEAEARLASGGTGYDLAIVALDTVGRMIAAGGLRPLALEQPSQFLGQNGDLLPAQFDVVPEAAGFVVPYIWGTTGLAYDVEAVLARIPDAPLDSWALVFDPDNARRLQDCGISIVDSNAEVVAAALAYLGRDPQSNTPEDLDAAMDVLDAIAPYVQWFETAQYDNLAEGEACLAITWSSDGFEVLSEQGPAKFNYVVPKEGSNVWVDVFVIPADAEHPDRGYQLLDYMLRPEVSAISAEYNSGIVTNPDIRARIGDAMFDHPALSLPEAVRESLYVIKPRDGLGKRVLDRRWRAMMLGLN